MPPDQLHGLLAAFAWLSTLGGSVWVLARSYRANRPPTA